MNAAGLFRGCAGVFLAALSIPVHAHPHGEQWALANEYPATSLPGEADAWFAVRVAELTQGGLSVIAMPDGRLGYKSREQLKAVAEGKIAMADTFAGALADEHPLFALSTLPFVVEGIAQARALYDAARPLYAAQLAKRNQKLLFATPWPASGLWSKRRIDSPGDLASLRIRAYDEAGAGVFVALAAASSVVSFADLPAKLERGEIDAVLSSGDGGAGAKLWGRLPFFTELSMAIPLSFTTVNLDKWRALDEATRAAVEEAARDAESRAWSAWDERRSRNYARMREHGVTISTEISAGMRTRLHDAGRTAASAWAGRNPEAAPLLAPLLR
jgi:TRAP-type C4-dicarboxylate transport system substrate-binding protein